MVQVLVVDDSDTLRSQLKKLLSSADINIVEAADGLQGLSVFSANPDIKLIISDINMPNMDGLTMCSKIAQMPEGKAVSMVILTTESNAEMKEKGKKIGVRAWVTKPHNDEKLLAAVKKLLSP